MTENNDRSLNYGRFDEYFRDKNGNIKKIHKQAQKQLSLDVVFKQNIRICFSAFYGRKYSSKQPQGLCH